MKTDLKIIILSIIEKSKDYLELSELIKKIQDLITNNLQQGKNVLDLTEKYNSIYNFVQNLILSGYIESKRTKGLPPKVEVKITKKGTKFLETIRKFLFLESKNSIKNEQISNHNHRERKEQIDNEEMEQIGGELVDLISEFDINDQAKEKLIERLQNFVVLKINEKLKRYS